MKDSLSHPSYIVLPSSLLPLIDELESLESGPSSRGFFLADRPMQIGCALGNIEATLTVRPAFFRYDVCRDMRDMRISYFLGEKERERRCTVVEKDYFSVIIMLPTSFFASAVSFKST